jgi:catalase-peroxidase
MMLCESLVQTYIVIWAKSTYLGPEVPAEELIWQDPVPCCYHALIDEQDAAQLKARILTSGLTVS